jgi:uncharacterized protein with HEPN domain
MSLTDEKIKTISDYFKSRPVLKAFACIKQMEIIGEAGNHVSDEIN